MSQKEAIEPLKFFADPECTREINAISWGHSETLLDGSQETDVLSEGENATAEVWIFNPNAYEFGIRNITFPDSRIQLTVSSAWIYPNKTVKLTVQFTPTPENTDGLAVSQISIDGFYIKRTVEINE
jgi:hypothetical protein